MYDKPTANIMLNGKKLKAFPLWRSFLHRQGCPFLPLLLNKGLEALVIVVQSSSRVPLSVTPWTAARQASLSLTISQSLPKFMSIASVMPSTHLILWYPLFLLPSIFPSIRDFSNEPAVCTRWPKYWTSASASVLPSVFRLISLKADWFDLLAVQGTFRSLLQFPSWMASILLALCLPYRAIRQEKEIKRNPKLKGRSKTITILSWMTLYIENPKNSIKKLL